LTASSPSRRYDAEKFIQRACGLKLRDFQRKWLQKLFKEQGGKRIYTSALLGLPRGNGKTELAAAVALYMLLERERAEVYIAAGSRDQASLAFKAARRI
jgi:phage terminase large subunit-like protein